MFQLESFALTALTVAFYQAGLPFGSYQRMDGAG